MEENSVHGPLLQSRNGNSAFARNKTRPFFASLAKWVLKFLIWVVFIGWVGLIFLYPAKFMSEFNQKWIQATSGTVFGVTGSIFLEFSGPVLIIALLSVAYVVISGNGKFDWKKNKNPSYSIWTFPVLVEGPFAVVCAAEFIGIVVFVVYVMWALYAYTMQILTLLSHFPPHSTFKLKSTLILELLGLRFGTIGILCMTFLFIPIARGSVLLRLIKIPFEHATRYHVWLGHLTMLLFTLHGLFYVIAWSIQGRLLQQITEWKDIGISNYPGAISLIAGILMWVTSLPPVRKKNFELFFYTHQLYVVFVVFLALHVGDFIFSIAAAGIFLFMLDRFLRFCQSRRKVDLISAKCLPCGTVELVLSKPQCLRYNALSFIFLQIRELSWLQWHPFSVSTSPLDGNHHISVLIKVLGKWTADLKAKILNDSDSPQQKDQLHSTSHSKITASVEGPYGHESPYHLTYENLVLVAGGIGISPFLAILSDILHRIRERKQFLPRNVLIVWAVKNSTELPLLSTVDVASICPFFSDKLSLDIRIFVTRESEPPLEEGPVDCTTAAAFCPLSTAGSNSGMSVLVGTGDNIWSGLYVISSTLGFIILLGLMDVYYINPYNISKWWYKGLLFVICMAATVLIFGGLIVGLWHVWEKLQILKSKEHDEDHIKVDKEYHQLNGNGNLGQKDSCREILESSTVVQYGFRPDFKEIFKSVSEKWGQVDVGIIVCGPSTLESTVAKEIRSHNLRRRSCHPIFHFNSHSFDL